MYKLLQSVALTQINQLSFVFASATLCRPQQLAKLLLNISSLKGNFQSETVAKNA